MYIYFIQDKATKRIKIGRTRNVSQRFDSLQNSSASKLTLLYDFYIKDESDEKKIHDYFVKYRLHGEWFKPDKKLLDFIKEEPKQKTLQKILIRGFDIEGLLANYENRYVEPMMYRLLKDSVSLCEICKSKLSREGLKLMFKKESKSSYTMDQVMALCYSCYETIIR